MITTSRHPCQDARRKLGEVVGRIDGLHALYDGNRIVVRVVEPHRHVQRIVRVDRTKYFSVARLPPGTYQLKCGAVFGGVFNEIHLGAVSVDREIATVRASGRGGVIRGFINGIMRPVPHGAKVELVSDSGEAHASVIDQYGKFFFSGLRRGFYRLHGHVPGQGIVASRVAEVGSRPDVVLDDVGVELRPRIRLSWVEPGTGRRRRRVRLRVTVGEENATQYASRLRNGEYLIDQPLQATAAYRVLVDDVERARGSMPADPGEVVVTLVEPLRESGAPPAVAVAWEPDG